jgi:hypothetical protein
MSVGRRRLRLRCVIGLACVKTTIGLSRIYGFADPDISGLENTQFQNQSLLLIALTFLGASAAAAGEPAAVAEKPVRH